MNAARHFLPLPSSRRRDVLAAVLFGLVAAPLWLMLLSVLNVNVKLPLMLALGHALEPLGPAATMACTNAFNVAIALVGGLVIALPLGYVVRGRALSLWVVFVLVFLVALFADAIAQGDFRTILWELTLPPVWLFVIWSGVFLYAGQKWRKRRGLR